MPALPTEGQVNWDVALNEFLQVGHNADGTNIGGGSTPSDSWELASGTSAGATQITLDRSAVPLVSKQGMVVIDPFTTEAEVRRFDVVSGSTLTLSSPGLAYAHASGDRVLYVPSGGLTTGMFGAKGDGGTDDEVALQWGLNETSRMGIWLDGENKTHLTSKPLLLNGKLRLILIKAIASYAPIDANNAMVMNQNGTILSFTATAADDTFTTPSAHGIPSDNIKVVFKAAPGVTLPGNLVAGRAYYARDRAGTTFKVSATSGGAALDLSSDGGGTVYSEVASLGRIFLEDVYIHGNDLVGMNGLDASLQQPAFANKLRIDRCDGFGMRLSGGSQHGVFTNFLSDRCRTCLKVEGAQFMYFLGFNAEKCDKAVHMASGGSSNGGNLFAGVHLEMNAGSGFSSSTSIAFDLDATTGDIFDEVRVSMNSTGPTIIDCSSSTGVGYMFRDLRLSGAPSSAGLLMLNDSGRGVTLDAYSDCRHRATEIIAPISTTADSLTDPVNRFFVGHDGRWVKSGSTRGNVPSRDTKAGSGQTSEVEVWRNSAGTKALAVLPGGALELGEQADPAAPAADFARFFARDNGSGKTQVCVRFPTGAVQVVATEP